MIEQMIKVLRMSDVQPLFRALHLLHRSTRYTLSTIYKVHFKYDISLDMYNCAETILCNACFLFGNSHLDASSVVCMFHFNCIMKQPNLKCSV